MSNIHEDCSLCKLCREHNIAESCTKHSVILDADEYWKQRMQQEDALKGTVTCEHGGVGCTCWRDSEPDMQGVDDIVCMAKELNSKAMALEQSAENLLRQIAEGL